MPDSKQVVAKAREYIDTPFAHQGRIKGKELDCVGLPLMVGEELALFDINGVPFSGEMYKQYGRQPLGTYVLDVCCKHLKRESARELKPGYIAVMRVETAACHVGIVSEKDGVLHIIHAYSANPGKVVEHEINYRWRKRIVAAFTFPGVE